MSAKTSKVIIIVAIVIAAFAIAAVAVKMYYENERICGSGESDDGGCMPPAQ